MRQDGHFPSALVGKLRETYPDSYSDRTDEELYTALSEKPEAMASVAKSAYPEYEGRSDEELHAAIVNKYPEYGTGDGDNLAQLLGKGLYRGVVHTVPMRLGNVIQAFGDYTQSMQQGAVEHYYDLKGVQAAGLSPELYETMRAEPERYPQTVTPEGDKYYEALRNAGNVSGAIKDYGALVTDFYEKARGEGWSAPDSEVEAAKWTERPFAKAASGFGEALPEFLGAVALFVATKSPAAPSIYYGVTGGSDTYVAAREEGVGVDEAAVYGIMNAAWVAVSEKAGLENVLNMDRIAQKAAARFARGFAVEGVQEVIEGVGTNLIEKGFDRERVILTLDEFIGNLVVGGLLGGSVRVGMRPTVDPAPGDVSVRPDIDEGDVLVRPDADEGAVSVDAPAIDDDADVPAIDDDADVPAIDDDVDVPAIDGDADAPKPSGGPLAGLEFPSDAQLARAINSINSVAYESGLPQQELDALLDMYGVPGEIERNKQVFEAAEADLEVQAQAAAEKASQEAGAVLAGTQEPGSIGPVNNAQDIVARLDAFDVEGIYDADAAGADSSSYDKYLSLMQTAFADNQVQTVTVPGIVRNPDAAINNFKGSGHTFVLINGRYVVDPYASTVAGITEQRVFDLENDSDDKQLQRIYGDRDLWSLNEAPVRPDADEGEVEPAFTMPKELKGMLNQYSRKMTKARSAEIDQRMSIQKKIRDDVAARGGLDVDADDYADYKHRMGNMYKWGPKSPYTRQTIDGPKSASIHGVDVAFEQYQREGWLKSDDTIDTMLEMLTGPAEPLSTYQQARDQQQDILDKLRDDNPQLARWFDVLAASTVRTREGLLRQTQKTIVDTVLNFEDIPGKTVKIQVEQLQTGDIVRMYDQLYMFQDRGSFVELVDGERLIYGINEEIVLEGVIPKGHKSYGAALQAYDRLQEMESTINDAVGEDGPDAPYSEDDLKEMARILDDAERVDFGRDLKGRDFKATDAEVLEALDDQRQQNEDDRKSGRPPSAPSVKQEIPKEYEEDRLRSLSKEELMDMVAKLDPDWLKKINEPVFRQAYLDTYDKNDFIRKIREVVEARHTVEDKPKSVVVKEVDPKTGQQSFLGYDESKFKLEIVEVEDGAAKIKQQEDEQAAADELEKRQRSLPGMDDDVDASSVVTESQPGVEAAATVDATVGPEYEEQKIRYEYFQNLPPGQKPNGEIMSREEIANFLANKLEITIWTGKIKMPRVLGFYRKWNQEIRLKMSNQLSVLTHEIGHYLHNVLFPADAQGGPRQRDYSQFDFAFDDELLVLSVETSPWLKRDENNQPQYDYQSNGVGPEKGTKNDAKTRAEGVAEFVRMYIMDPDQARAKAPRFFEHWEARLKADANEHYVVLKEAQEMTLRYLTQTPLEHVKSNIVVGVREKARGTYSEWFNSFFDDLKGPRPITQALNRITSTDWFKKAYTDWSNENDPITRALNSQVDERFGLTQANADYVTRLITSYVGGWRAKVERTLKYDSINLHGDVVGPGLKQILGKVPNHRIDDFRAYLVALRSTELHERGIKTGILPYAAKKVVEQHAGEFEAIRKELLRFQGQQLQLLVESGILSESQKREIMRGNKYYVPFYRAFEVSGRRVSGPKAGSGYIDVRSPVYKMFGSERPIIDPLESILRNSYVFREAAERNQIALEFTKMMRKSGESGHILTEVTKDVKATPVRDKEIYGLLRDSGILEDLAFEADVDVDEFAQMAKERMGNMEVIGNIYRAVNSTRPELQQFEVWENGKVRVYQVAAEHQDLYRALSMMDKMEMQILQRLKIPFARTIQLGTKWVRVGSTLSPEFMARNPFRDQLGAAIYSRHGYFPFVDLFKGLSHLVKEDEVYQDWLAAGGPYSDFLAADRANVYKSLDSLIGDDPTTMEFALSLMNPKNVLSNLQTASGLFENATRMGEWDRARRAATKDPSRLGLDAPPSNYDIDLYAVAHSKDIVLNFNKFGAKSRIINSYSAFFNAQIRDWVKLSEEHIEAIKLAEQGDLSRLKQIGTKAFMLVTLPSIITWILGHDEEEIQGLPDWRKNLFWNIYIPDSVVRVNPLGQRDGFVLSIPKPFLLGQVYGTPVERALDALFTEDKKAVGRWAKEFLASNVPNPAEMNIIIPATENFVNKSFFRKAPLESYSQQRLEPRLRYHESTSEVAKFLGSKINYSPIKIDNLVRGHFSTLGKYGLDLTDKLMIVTRLADVPPAPKSGLERVPVAKGFVHNPYAPQRYLGEFHESLKRAESRINTAKSGLIDKDDRWFDKNKRALAFYLHYDGNGKQRISNLRAMQKKLGDITQASKDARSDYDMKPAQKRERLIELKRQRDDLSRTLMQNGYFHPDDIR